jgi:hypothetical protein
MLAAEAPHGDVGRANETLAGRERRGLRRLAVNVREDDLHVIAEHGYEAAASADQDQQAQAVGLFKRHGCLSRPRRVTSSRNGVAVLQ